MASLIGTLLILTLGLAVADAAYYPMPKRADKCKDKRSPCHYYEPYCPWNCQNGCYVDCNSCRTLCKAPPSPPPHHSGGKKKVRCMNKKFPKCYYKEHTCPSACPGSCEVDCLTCRPVCHCDRPGTVCQDPKFIGADGITFYFHGKKERDFCLVTDSNLHINGHFIGKRNETMKRDFTWVQSLGILFDHHKLSVGALKTGKWNNAIDRLDLAFDGKTISLPESEGTSWRSGDGLTITRSENVNSVEIDAQGHFKIKAKVVPISQKESLTHNYGITDEDCFAHLDLNFKFYSLSGEVNGVLGQTYAANYVSRVKMAVEMPVLGGDKEFESSSLFSTDCSVARFVGKDGHVDIGKATTSTTAAGKEFADLQCGSGAASYGMLACKR